MADNNSPASPAGEINPGTDPDFDEEMDVEDYEIAIANCADDPDCVKELLAEMPEDVFDEYADLDYPGLPDELRPDYEPVEDEEEGL